MTENRSAIGHCDAPKRNIAASESLIRVLIVDDDADSREVLAELVTLLGHQAITAGTAKEALACIEIQQPTLGILDISLADTDGCELIRCIRAQPFGGRMRFVALTGHSDPGTRAAVKLAGFHEFCLKPIDLQTLKMLLEQEGDRLVRQV
jgi:CheY-like chemotaxis protein